jgi:hypothetical protein
LEDEVTTPPGDESQHESGDDDQGSEGSEGIFGGLSDEAKERLAKAFVDSGLAERFQEIVPKIDFAPLLRSPAVERILKSFSDNLPKVELPAINRLSAQVRQQIAGLANLPTFDTSAFEQLAKASTVNFPKIEYPDFGKYAENLFKGIDLEALRAAAARVHPRNLRGDYGIDDEILWAIMVDEGIPCFLVPDTESVAELRSQPDAAARRSVLVARSDPIFAQCELILGEVTNSDITFLVEKVQEAIAAFRTGQTSAAQALATNVLDSALQDYASLTHRDYVTGKRTAPGGLTRASYVGDLPYVEAVALAPVVKAHEADNRPDPPKVEYTRHGTTHRVSRQQYTEANAVQAIMLVTSVLGFVQGLW